MNKWYVYMVMAKDKTLYTGITLDIERRLEEHNNSKLGSKSLRGKRPVKLFYQETLNSRSEALKRESEIKNLSREEKLMLTNQGP